VSLGRRPRRCCRVRARGVSGRCAGAPGRRRSGTELPHAALGRGRPRAPRRARPARLSPAPGEHGQGGDLCTPGAASGGHRARTRQHPHCLCPCDAAGVPLQVRIVSDDPGRTGLTPADTDQARGRVPSRMSCRAERACRGSDSAGRSTRRRPCRALPDATIAAAPRAGFPLGARAVRQRPAPVLRMRSGTPPIALSPLTCWAPSGTVRAIRGWRSATYSVADPRAGGGHPIWPRRVSRSMPGIRPS